MVNCRVCLEDKRRGTILNQKNKKTFFQITGIELDEATDEFLCGKCYDVFLTAKEFRKNALEAEDWLQKQKLGLLESEDDLSPEVKCEIFVAEQLVVEPIELPKEENEELFYLCDLCKEQFSTYTSIRSHIRQHRKELGRHCRFCPEIFPNRTQTTAHEQKHFKKEGFGTPIVCEECGKVCAGKSALRSHKRSHKTTYKCTVPGCIETFSRKMFFYNHLATHGNKYPVSCLDCDKRFKNHNTLSFHRRLSHNDGRRFDCPECPQKFLTQSELEKHIAVKHRGEKNYACRICTNRYGVPFHLKRHYQSSHYDEYLKIVNAKISWGSMRVDNQS